MDRHKADRWATETEGPRQQAELAGSEPMRPCADDRPYLATWSGRRPEQELHGAMQAENFNVTSPRPPSPLKAEDLRHNAALPGTATAAVVQSEPITSQLRHRPASPTDGNGTSHRPPSTGSDDDSKRTVAPAAARPSHRQPIKIGTYDGTSAFETFVAKFNNAAVYNGWNNEVACESSETRMIRTNDDAAPLGRVAGLLLLIWKIFYICCLLRGVFAGA